MNRAATPDRRPDRRITDKAMVPLTGQRLAEAAYFDLLRNVEGPDLREDLIRTPLRAALAWGELTRGYTVDVAAMMTTFESAGEADEIVCVSGIPVYSLCEHHLLPFIGEAAIAYLPNGKVLGLSKFARLTDAYARRLQIQERLTSEIADAIEEHLDPRGIGVVIRARHMCMELRGVAIPGALTTTSVCRRMFREDARARAEALTLMGA